MPFAYLVWHEQPAGDLRGGGFGWRWPFPLDDDGDFTIRVGQEMNFLTFKNHIDDWDEYDDDGGAVGFQWLAGGPEVALIDSPSVRFHAFVEGFVESSYGDDGGDYRNLGDTSGVGVRPGLGLIVRVSEKIALHFEGFGQWTTQDFTLIDERTRTRREVEDPFSFGGFIGVGCRF
jgi:hypothetical protein